MSRLADLVAEVATREQSSFAVRVDVGSRTELDVAYGLADRANGTPNRNDTVFAAASVAKGFTALTVLRLVETGVLQLHTTARSLLGDDLPLIHPDVTVEQLLAHRGGIGDYFDEDATEHIDDYVLTVAPHLLGDVESYLQVLDGYPMKATPGAEFAYCNSGFVVLALLAQRASGTSYFELVDELVCRPAGLHHTSFLRSDTTLPNVARNYLHRDDLRTNVLHMPLLGGGDGGVHTTTADLHALWAALYDGRILRPDTLTMMTTPRSATSTGSARYGLGCWLGATTDTVEFQGYDAGISASTMHRPSTGVTATVLANTSDGAWPIARLLVTELGL